MKYRAFYLLLFILAACDSSVEAERISPLTPEDLIQHSQEFKKGVISVNDLSLIHI